MSPWYPCGCCEELVSPCDTDYGRDFSYDFSGSLPSDANYLPSGKWSVSSNELLYSTTTNSETGSATRSMSTPFSDETGLNTIYNEVKLVGLTGSGRNYGINFLGFGSSDAYRFYYGLSGVSTTNYGYEQSLSVGGSGVSSTDTGVAYSAGDVIKMVMEVTSVSPTIDFDVKCYVNGVLAHTESGASSYDPDDYLTRFCIVSPGLSRGTGSLGFGTKTARFDNWNGGFT